MSSQIHRPGSTAAAAVAIGGVLLVAMPQHGMSIIRLVIVSVAAAAALYALAINAPARWWRSPFERAASTEGSATGSRDVDWIHRELGGWRRRVPGGTPLPPEVLGLLRPLVEAAVERESLRAGVRGGVARVPLSPLARAILRSDPADRPRWYRLVRPDRRTTAAAVHRVLDELDRLAAGAASARPLDSLDPRAT